MNKRLLFIGFLFILIQLPNAVSANPLEGIMEKQFDQLDTSVIEKFWQKLNEEYREYMPNTNAPTLKELIFSEDGKLRLSNFFSGLLKYLLHEVLLNGKLLGTIILLTIFASILENFQSSFSSSNVSKVANSITFLVLIILAVNSFYSSSQYAKEAIQGMMDFMLAIIPILLALLSSMGNVTTAALFHPLIVFMVNMSTLLIYYVIFPLIFFSTVLDLVSMLSERYKLTRLASLMKQVGVGLLSIFFTVFLGIISVQGAVTSVGDGLVIRTAKYVTGNFVPVVGRMFSDAAETVIGASLLLKNGVGVVGVIILLFIAMFPAIKIIAVALIYKFSSAVLQPLGSNTITSTLNTIGNSMLLIFAALATVSLMFFLAITIIVTAANISVMVR